jgi:predicted metalloprotease with PDZ domain
MKILSIVCMLLLYAPCVDAADHLSARFSDDLAEVSVELCFDGRAPDRLYRNSQADDWSDGVYLADSRLRISERHGEVRLPTLPENACIHWQVDIRAALKKSNYRLVLQRGDDLVMSADLWFWKASRSRDLIVNVSVPEGMSFSTPWALVESTGQFTTYRPDRTPAIWESRIAIGRFKLQTIEVPGAHIRLAALGDLSDEQNEKFRLWIKESVLAVASVFGSFPQSQPQVLVIPAGRRREATLRALVTRGGGMAVTLMVDENRPLEEFTSDWTATHEFSHMLFPYISSRDRWLSEGLASYYQNVLRARNGRLTEKQAWQKLYEGFRRGEKGTHGGSLAQATRDGWRSTMRVYWSGAALMLQADMQLRETSNGRQSLDTVLQSLSYCCLENGRTWRAKEMFAKLDELSNTQIFSDLYDKHVHAENFPDMRSTWEYLGVNTRYNQVRLTADAPLADVRRSIMKG